MSIIRVALPVTTSRDWNKRRMRRKATAVRWTPLLTMTVILSVVCHSLVSPVQAFVASRSTTFSTSVTSSSSCRRRGSSSSCPPKKTTTTCLPFASTCPRTTATTRLSIAHAPNVHNNHNHNSSGEDQQLEVDWSTILDPPHPEPPLMTSTTEEQPLTAADWQTIGVTLASMTGLLAVLMQLSGPGAWRYYLAGGVCAATSHAIPVPIDVIKTRKQVDPAYCDLTMPAATQKLLQTEGPSALFVGMGPTVWGYFMEGAVKFGVYEILKPWLALLLPNISQLLSFCACATISGLAAGTLLCPMEALRIRLVAEPRYAAQGWIRGGLRMLRAEGATSLTRGLTPMLWKQIPYTITKNVSFDVLTKFLYKTGAVSTMMVPLAAAAAASVLSCLSSQPGDMLLSVVSAHEGERRRTRDVMKQIFHSDRGFRGFFVGLKTRFLHVGMIVTVQLLIYDFVKRLVGIAATGSV